MEQSSFRIKQWGYGEGAQPTFVYVTALPVKILIDKGEIDRWSSKNKDGYQRTPIESRVRPEKGSVVKYILHEAGIFPTSVLLNIRGETMEFESKLSLAPNIDWGLLHIKDDVKFWIIDGQHRIEALKRTISTHPELENYPLPVSILNLNQKFDELVHFYIVNSRQKKISTAIAYRHMQRMFEEVKIKGSYKWLASVVLGQKQERNALAAMVVDYLAEHDDSPFKNKIRLVGDEREEWHLIEDQVLIRYISSLFGEKTFAGITPEKLAEDLILYWSAIKNLYPSCFEVESKGRYTLLKHTGIASFTYLYPAVYSLCAIKGGISLNNFVDTLSLLKKEANDTRLDPDFRRPIDEQWWSRESGPAIALATSEKVFRKIAEEMAKKIRLLSGDRV